MPLCPVPEWILCLKNQICAWTGFIYTFTPLLSSSDFFRLFFSLPLLSSSVFFLLFFFSSSSSLSSLLSSSSSLSSLLSSSAFFPLFFLSSSSLLSLPLPSSLSSFLFLCLLPSLLHVSLSLFLYLWVSLSCHVVGQIPKQGQHRSFSHACRILPQPHSSILFQSPFALHALSLFPNFPPNYDIQTHNTIHLNTCLFTI